MNTTTHPVAHEEIKPEAIMAWLDGELPTAEARTVAAHIDQCAECASLASKFRATSQSLSDWTVPPVPAQLKNSVTELAQQKTSGKTLPKQRLFIRTGLWTGKQWTLGAGCAAFVFLLAIRLSIPLPAYKMALRPRTTTFLNPQGQSESIDGQPLADKRSIPLEGRATHMDSLTSVDPGANGYSTRALQTPAQPPPPPATAKKNDRAIFADSGTFATLSDDKPSNVAGRGGGGGSVPSAAAPMIARTVSLAITVKDFAAARASLDAILTRHQGYPAQLTISTPEHLEINPRNFQASLRIPAPQLAAALAEMRSLGRVQNESQSGEEVTQQHTDLVARLKNSRETEARLQAILQQRTGKVEEVLQVEEEIERVRGEIESMEADQKKLEHRVDFASVDLQLTEEYKAQFNAPASSASTRMHNAFIAGLDNASATLLGIVLFFEEYGPALLIWLAILGLPGFFVWHRYRKARSKF
ncbi:MAG: DUF4349 domain-containing protein [Terracidiphilus sp.]|jgi:hypothetical protein